MVLDMLALVLLVLPVFNWYVAWRLWSAGRKLQIPALRERMLVQVVLSLVATAVGAMGLIQLNMLTDAAFLPLLVIVALGVSVPAVVWYWMDHRGW